MKNTLPIAPFDGQPLRYQSGSNRIYSNGEDLIDASGRDAEHDGTAPDIVLPITR